MAKLVREVSKKLWIDWKCFYLNLFCVYHLIHQGHMIQLQVGNHVLVHNSGPNISSNVWTPSKVIRSSRPLMEKFELPLWKWTLMDNDSNIGWASTI